MRDHRPRLNRTARAAAYVLVGLMLIAACGAPPPPEAESARWDSAVWDEGRWAP